MHPLFSVFLILLLSFWLQTQVVRPQIITPLFCVIYFITINKQIIKYWTLIIVTLLTWIWTNLHGGFVIGLFLLLSGLVSECINKYLKLKDVSIYDGKLKMMFWLAMLSFLITFINPYGIKIYIDILQGIHYPSFDWVNIYLWPPNTHYITLIIIIAIFFYFSLSIINFQFSDFEANNYLAQSLMVYYFLITARRLDWLLFIPTYHMLNSIQYSINPYTTSILSRRIMVPVLLLLFIIIKYISIPTALKSTEFPKEYENYFQNESLVGNMFCPLTWSGKVTLLTKGKIKIYIDGRLGLYPKHMFFDYLAILNTQGLTYGQIVNFDIKYLFIPLSKMDHFILSSSPIRWKPLQVRNRAILLERIDSSIK